MLKSKPKTASERNQPGGMIDGEKRRPDLVLDEPTEKDPNQPQDKKGADGAKMSDAQMRREIKYHNEEHQRLKELLKAFNRRDLDNPLNDEETAEIAGLGGAEGIRTAILDEESASLRLERRRIETRVKRDKKKLDLGSTSPETKLKELLEQRRQNKRDGNPPDRELNKQIRIARKIIKDEGLLSALEIDLGANREDREKAEKGQLEKAEAAVDAVDTEGNDGSEAREEKAPGEKPKEEPRPTEIEDDGDRPAIELNPEELEKEDLRNSTPNEKAAEPRKTIRQRLSDWWHRPSGIKPGKPPAPPKPLPGLKELFVQTWGDIKNIFEGLFKF